LEEAHGPQIDVLLELAADRDQQIPERDMVGDRGPADGAEEDRIMPGNTRETVGGHHAAGALIEIAAPVELFPGEPEAVTLRRRFEHLARRGDHLLADAVALDHGDAKSGHGFLPLSRQVFRGSRDIVSIHSRAIASRSSVTASRDFSGEPILPCKYR